MAMWKCVNCGVTKESRCKPKKCSNCEGIGTMEKVDIGTGRSSEKECGNKRSCRKKIS